MRDTRFRGLAESGEWKFGSLVRTTNGKAYILQINNTTIEGYNQNWLINTPAFQVIPSSVSQFTGQKDKNGNELFEGDTFHIGDKNILYVIEWVDCGFKGRQISNTSYVGLEFWHDKIVFVKNINDNEQMDKINQIKIKENE